MHRSIHRSLVAVASAAIVAGCVTSAAAQGTTQWAFAGRDLGNTRNAATEKKLTPANVGGLKVKWQFRTNGDISATPAVEKQGTDTIVYAVDWGTGRGGNLYALNGNTGAVRWSRAVGSYTGNPNGSVVRTTPAIVGNLLVFGDQGDTNSDGFPQGSGYTASVMAVDKNTGELVWRSVLSDHLFSIITSSPVAAGGVLYVGVASLEENAGFIPGYVFSWRGKMVALDIKTGATVWETRMIDDTSYALGYTGASVWGSTPVVDAARGSLYVTTGNNYSSPIGTGNSAGPETPAGNLIDTLMALDLRTGAIKWTYRSQPADTWDVARWVNMAFGGVPDPTIGPDYDFASGANLFSLPSGKQVVGAGAKSGIYHALDPDTGRLLWQTQVGPGGTGGGIEWGSAVDGKRVYVAIANSNDQVNELGTRGGLWAGLDAATGKFVWRTADPIVVDQTAQAGFPFFRWGHDFGAVTVANGVVFAGSTGGPPIPGLAPGYPGAFFALDAATGRILWQFASDGAVNAGAAVVDGTVYWGGGGYSHLTNAFGITGTPSLFAFAVK